MDITQLLKNIKGFEPYDYQTRAWEAIEGKMSKGGNIIIEIPTAGGKTEASTLPFLYQFLTGKWKVPRLIYVLPTRSLVEKQAQRLKNDVEHLLHLKGYPKGKCKKISKDIVQIEYGLKPTHAFLGYIVLTTWDSFLYGLAAHRTVGDRFTFPAGAITQSLVVFDEVQMYQDENLFMPQLIGLIFEKLEETNVPFIFMTATLPTKLKVTLNIQNAETITARAEDERQPTRGKVDVEMENKLDDETLLTKVKKTLGKDKKVLVIRNTVDRAVQTYQKIEKKINEEVTLIHSRFTVRDREKKEKAIEQADVIVATQVVEAGLDMEDIGLVITDLAPLDALIQRIGRCARRKGEKGKAIVVLPEFDEELVAKNQDQTVLGLKQLNKRLKSSFEENKEVELLYESKNRKIVAKIGSDSYEVMDYTNEELTRTSKGNIRGKRQGIPYSTLPYDPLIMLKTYDEVQNVEQYLYDIELARHAMDNIYREYYKNKIQPPRPKNLHKAYTYFKELKLFSAPPEYELKARPSLFAKLYPLQNGKNGKEIDFSSDNIIRVNFDWLRYNWEKGKKLRNKIHFELKKTYDKAKEMFEYRLIEMKSSRPRPYATYTLNKKYYSKNIGITETIVREDRYKEEDNEGTTTSSQNNLMNYLEGENE